MIRIRHNQDNDTYNIICVDEFHYDPEKKEFFLYGDGINAKIKYKEYNSGMYPSVNDWRHSEDSVVNHVFDTALKDGYANLSGNIFGEYEEIDNEEPEALSDNPYEE